MTVIVSVVSYQFLPAKFGGQKAIAFLYKYLSQNLELVCISTRNNDVSKAEGYEVLPLLSTSPLRYINLFYFFRIKKVLNKYRATHLLIEHPYYGWLAILLKIFCKVKLVVHSHNIEGLRWKALGKWWWRILWQYEKFTHRQADFNFFITQNDLEYAIREFGLNPGKCMVTTFGIERNRPPSNEEKREARESIAAIHNIGSQESLLLFNGAFDYKPNLDALIALLENINPLLAASGKLEYKLIICGRNIPANISERSFPNVVIPGFVDDIDIYFKSADVFLNPVVEGGGIKTKLVEAIGFNCNVVSTVTGSIGVDPSICNGKLLIVPDNDWKSFSARVIEAAAIRNQTGPAYYDHFYGGYSSRKAAVFIETNSLPKEATS